MNLPENPRMFGDKFERRLYAVYISRDGKDSVQHRVYAYSAEEAAQQVLLSERNRIVVRSVEPAAPGASPGFSGPGTY